jgi:hypothetical protein
MCIFRIAEPNCPESSLLWWGGGVVFYVLTAFPLSVHMIYGFEHYAKISQIIF